MKNPLTPRCRAPQLLISVFIWEAFSEAPAWFVFRRLPLVSICLSTPDRGRKWGWLGHMPAPGVCLIHHKSWKALGGIQGYLVSPRCAPLLPYDDRTLPQRGWSVFPIRAEAALEGTRQRRVCNRELLQMENNDENLFFSRSNLYMCVVWRG